MKNRRVTRANTSEWMELGARSGEHCWREAQEVLVPAKAQAVPEEHKGLHTAVRQVGTAARAGRSASGGIHTLVGPVGCRDSAGSSARPEVEGRAARKARKVDKPAVEGSPVCKPAEVDTPAEAAGSALELVLELLLLRRESRRPE